jgi:hypothetical protein
VEIVKVTRLRPGRTFAHAPRSGTDTAQRKCYAQRNPFGEKRWRQT